MKRSFFQATSLIVASGFVLPLFAQPARADDSIILRCTPSFDHCAHATTLPLYGGWIDAKHLWYIITDASDVNGAGKLGIVYSPDPASVGIGATRHVAQLGDRYVFEAGPDFSQQRSYEGSVADRYSSFARFGSVAGALNAPTFAPDGERPYAQNGYQLLLNEQVLPGDNAPRITDFSMFAAQGAYQAGLLVNYPDVVLIIRL
jgi:hypothetical protein